MTVMRQSIVYLSLTGPSKLELPSWFAKSDSLSPGAATQECPFSAGAVMGEGLGSMGASHRRPVRDWGRGQAEPVPGYKAHITQQVPRTHLPATQSLHLPYLLSSSKPQSFCSNFWVFILSCFLWHCSRNTFKSVARSIKQYPKVITLLASLHPTHSIQGDLKKVPPEVPAVKRTFIRVP